jgi:hypothetical protein
MVKPPWIDIYSGPFPSVWPESGPVVVVNIVNTLEYSVTWMIIRV